MKIKDVLRETRSKIASKGIHDADLEGEVLVMHSLSMGRAQLYVHLEEEYSEEPKTIQAMLARRLAGDPLAYIIGQREFYATPIQVNSNVLIPRQETELLVDITLELARGSYKEGATIADVGTGSGAIAIALAVNLPNATIYATDISYEALQTAKANIGRHKLHDRVRLLRGDLLTPLPERVDIVAANLPYIPTEEISTLAPEIHKEPQIALDGGTNGVEVITRLLRQAPDHLKLDSALILEIDPRQKDLVVEIAQEVFSNAEVSVAKDFAGLDRVVLIRR